MIRVKFPDGVSELGHNGKTYRADHDGCVEVEEKELPAFVDMGFYPAESASKPEKPELLSKRGPGRPPRDPDAPEGQERP